MGTQTDYFNKIGYTGIYEIGDRVFGYFNKIPFVGTVGNDRCINGVDKEVTIHLDLPMRIDNHNHQFIIVKHKNLKRLVSMDDEEPLKLPKAGSIPAKRTKQGKK